MTGPAASRTYTPSFGSRSGEMMTASFVCCRSAYFEPPPACLLFMDEFWKLTDSFFRAVPLDPSSYSSFSYATQILILQWGLSAREEIQPGDCFDIVGQSPGKPFCSVTEGVLDLEPLAPRLKHLI